MLNDFWMCWFPDVEVCDESKGYFVKWLVRHISHLQWVHLCFCVFPFAEGAVCNVFVDVFVHFFPGVLPFDEVIGPLDASVAQFIMCFNVYCKTP